MKWQNPYERKRITGDFFSHNMVVLWRSKKNSYTWFAIGYGIRRSDRIQLFPVWNMSNNSQKSLLFGFWKLYVQIIYHY